MTTLHTSLRTKLWLLMFAVIMATTLAPGLAAAQSKAPVTATSASDKNRAEELRQQGNALMADLKYEEALRAFDKAYAVDANPALLYNRGRALQALNRMPEALDAIEAFAKKASPELKKRVPALAELLAETRAKVSRLRIDSNVAGARVIVRGEVLGVTPLLVRLNVGDAAAEVSADGYRPHQKSLTLEGGKEQLLTATLVPIGTTGVLMVTSPVAGARVFVDGADVGRAPTETTLEAGTHRIVVGASG